MASLPNPAITQLSALGELSRLRKFPGLLLAMSLFLVYSAHCNPQGFTTPLLSHLAQRGWPPKKKSRHDCRQKNMYDVLFAVTMLCLGTIRGANSDDPRSKVSASLGEPDITRRALVLLRNHTWRGAPVVIQHRRSG